MMPSERSSQPLPSPTLTRPSTQPLFPLGRLLATPGALHTLETFSVSPLKLIQRHVRGDWGDLDDHDRQENELALISGLRIFSAYTLTRQSDTTPVVEKVWCITEADRSCTTLLLPSEY